MPPSTQRRPRRPPGRAAPSLIAAGAALAPAAALLGDAPEAVAGQALALASAVETIEAAYAAWDELRAAQAQSRRRLHQERRRLDEQGELLVGAVRSAAQAGGQRGPPPSVDPGAVVLAEGASVERLLAEARAGLDEARARLEREEAATEETLARALAEIRATARARVEGRCRLAPPRLCLLPRTLGPGSRILHVERPSAEEAVCLFFALSGRIPSRYAAPFDDSVDDVLAGPAVLYADEDIGTDEVRPTPARLHDLLRGLPDVWPVKGALLAVLPGSQPPRFVRWVTRGPVLEAELEDGPGFRNVLSREEAERVTGALLALQLGGRLALELGRG